MCNNLAIACEKFWIRSVSSIFFAFIHVCNINLFLLKWDRYSGKLCQTTSCVTNSAIQIISVSHSLRIRHDLFLLSFEVKSLFSSRKQLRSSVSQNKIFFLFLSLSFSLSIASFYSCGRCRRCVSVRKILSVTKIDTSHIDLFDVFSLLPPDFHFHVTSTSTLISRIFLSRLDYREVKKHQSVTISWQIARI